MTSDQLDHWFRYHAPTAETSPKYAAIRAAEGSTAQCVSALLNGGELATHDNVNERCKEYAKVIDMMTPESADKSAAIRCVRLAKNALNEAIVVAKALGREEHTVVSLAHEARAELRRARWQACAAIACDGR